MAEAMAGAAIKVLIKNLISMLSDEIKLFRGFKKDLAKLRDALITTQEFLSDAEEKEIKDKAAKKWLMELEDIVFEADNVLDEINHHLLRKKVKSQKQETEVSSSSSSDSVSWFVRSNMARKINDLNKKLKKINKKAVTNGLKQEIVTAPNARAVGIIETDSFSVEPNIIGRKLDVEKIVQMVVNAPLDEKISVLPIVGMGGLGKTTVARQVFNDKEILNHFQKRMWVCVSSDFDEVTLFQKILETLTGENVQGNVTKEVMLQKIKENLTSKKYLIILDDVWNDDFIKWEGFMNSLLGISNVLRNFIVVTTRQQSVASLPKMLPSYKLLSLTIDDCWSIIKGKSLPSVDDHMEYKEIGMCIAEKCGGLPLVANVIGGMVRGQPKEEWSFILKNQLSGFAYNGHDHVMKILKLSYDRLPSSPLRRCFAYCSIFPQDFQIEKETIIEQWLAEGFLENDQGNDYLENIGSRLFNHLLHASLIQESKRDWLGNITHCKMHDLVHDLACLVSGQRSTSIVKDSGDDSVKIRYVYQNSLVANHISKERAKYLRTLILDSEVVGKEFSGFRSLHVLKLDSSVKELPIEIMKQIHMRFLDISNTKITKLPDSIKKLSNLQTLVVTNLQNLPNTIIELINLRHLHISAIELPPFIGKLTSLRTLPYYIVGDDSGGRIGELKSLKNLKGFLTIQNLERVKDEEEAKLADLFGKPNILKLVLDWTGSREGEKNDEYVLEGLQPHPNLKALGIRGYESKNFPSWTMNMRVYGSITLTNLMDIGILDCQIEMLPNLGHLPRLKFLALVNLQFVKSISRSFYGLECGSTSSVIDEVNTPKTTIVFPALEKLWLTYIPNLLEWEDVESGVGTFPCVQYLEITSCPRLKSVPCRFPSLLKLRVEEIGSNVSLTNIFTNSSSLQTLTIKSYWGILHSLELGEYPVGLGLLEILIYSRILNSSQEDSITLLHSLRSLQILEIADCPNLNSIPSFDLRSLQTLHITGCPSLTNLPLDLLESCTTSLEKLTLIDLPSLENIDSLMSSISRMSSLERMSLIYLPKLTRLPMGIGILKSLWFIEIGGFLKVDQVSINDFLQLVGSPNIQFLSIQGNEDWKFLPENIQHLSLYELIIGGYGIEALPEWTGNFSSLQRLTIGHCKRLRQLPSKETMQRLKKLSHFWILGCPMLNTQQESTSSGGDGDSEWSKISHVEFVKVDDKLLPTRDTPAEHKFPDFRPALQRYTD